MSMSRVVIRKVFVTGLVVGVVGAILLLLAMPGGQLANGQLYNAGLLLSGFGGVLEVVSWIMALVASALLGRWGWFVALLILGLIGLLLLVMIVYAVAGPATTRRGQPREQRKLVAT